MKHDFALAAASYDSAAVLARETGLRMAERLDYVRIAPRVIADIGCATGEGLRELMRRYPSARPLAIDFARPMLGAVRAQTPFLQRFIQHMRGKSPQLINADVRALPLAAGSLGLAWSNLMLHWVDDPQPAFLELHRALEVGGLLMFSVLGPDTLKELRDAGSKTGINPPLRRFIDMHDLGDMLLAAGFADPVMDMEMLTLTYATPRRLLADQRHLGVRNGMFGGMGWRDWRRLFHAYEESRVAGRLPATFEILYGHAWKPQPRVAEDGRAIIRFTDKQK